MSATEITEEITEVLTETPQPVEEKPTENIKPKRERTELQKKALEKSREKAFEVRRIKKEVKAKPDEITIEYFKPPDPIVPAPEAPAPEPIAPAPPVAVTAPELPKQKFRYDNISGHCVLQ